MPAVSAARPLAFITARFASGLGVIAAALSLLALILSRALPGAGAIAFLAYRDGNDDIYVLDIGRGTLHNLTDNGAVNGSFAFSPDGTRIAFESNLNGNTELYMMTVECPGLLVSCGGIRQLTDHETDSRGPVWSPDGKQIAYMYDVSIQDADNEIYVMDVESGVTRNLSNHPGIDNLFSWSRKSNLITFLSDRDGNMEIYTMNANGSELRRLTINDALDWYPVWSPDNQRIAFVSDQNSISEIFVANSDGSNLQRVGNLDLLGTIPAWSPDGRWLAFGSIRDETSDIYLMDILDEKIVRVTQDENFEGQPAWSPDGRHLVFVAERDLNFDIYILSAIEGDIRRLTSEANVFAPAWWP